MSFMQSVKALFGLDFTDQARRELKHDEDSAGREIAARFGRGSVGIQKGAFMTRSDIDLELSKADIPPPPPRDR